MEGLTREIFWNVPGHRLFYLLALISLMLFLWGTGRRIRFVLQGHSTQVRAARRSGVRHAFSEIFSYRTLAGSDGSSLWHLLVFCGFGEPLERLELVLEITRWVKKHYWKIVRVDTNGQGYLLNKGRDVVRELKEAGVDKVIVSLIAQDKETYNQVCKPIFGDAHENVLKFIKKAKDEGLDTEATAVTIPETELEKVKELAKNMGVKFSLREYIPCFW